MVRSCAPRSLSRVFGRHGDEEGKGRSGHTAVYIGELFQGLTALTVTSPAVQGLYASAVAARNPRLCPSPDY